MWAVVLLPPLLRARSGASGDSIAAFNDRLALIGRTNGTLAPLPDEPPLTTGVRATRRRREVLRVLLGAVGITALAAIGIDDDALLPIVHAERHAARAFVDTLKSKRPAAIGSPVAQILGANPEIAERLSGHATISVFDLSPF